MVSVIGQLAASPHFANANAGATAQDYIASPVHSSSLSVGARHAEGDATPR
jgi:hypothetical protein